MTPTPDREPPQAYSADEYKRAIERRSIVEEKLRHDTREIVEVLKIDVPVFLKRSAERRFVTNPECEKWNDSQVKSFKQEVAQVGEKVSRELAKTLEPIDVWQWDPRAQFPDDPHGLEPNVKVWNAVRRIGEELASLLDRHGFPDAASAEQSYKLPSYFVGGRFMKSLVESYWRGLQEHVELTAIIEEASSRDRREKLKARWDKA